MTLGSHGDTMVPVPSMVKVDGKPLTEVADAGTIERLVQRTRDGGAEVVALLKSGSAYYAPSSAAAAMVAAVLGDTGEVMPVCAWVTGQYGIDGVYLGVPAKLGRAGVAEVVELPLTDERAGRAPRGRRGRPFQAGRRGQAHWLTRPTGERSPGCALCAARPLTPWFHQDERCWVADCLICRTPMVVWRRHGPDPSPEEREHMLARLSEVAAARLGEGAFRIDANDAPHPRPLPRPRPRPRLAGVRLEPLSRPSRRRGRGFRVPGTSSRGRWRPGRRG